MDADLHPAPWPVFTHLPVPGAASACAAAGHRKRAGAGTGGSAGAALRRDRGQSATSLAASCQGTGRWQVAVCERQRWDTRDSEQNYPDTRVAFPSLGSLGESFRLLALLSDIILVLLGVSQYRDRNSGS